MKARSFLSVAAVLALAATAVACESSDTTSGSRAADQSSSSGGSPSQNAGQGKASPQEPSNFNNGAAAERAIKEADIVQLAEGRLYAISKSGTVSIIDVSKPGSLSMLGQAYLPGQPFEMYLRGELLVVMTNNAYSVTGSVNEPAKPTKPSSDGIGDGESQSSSSPPSSSSAADPNSGAGVIVINVKDPGLMQRVATFPVAGEIADSRIVGDILYLATYENSYCYRCASQPSTMVTTFDISTPSAMRQVDQAAFESTGTNAWGAQAFKRSVVVTKERMYVGGPGNNITDFNGTTTEEGVIDVLDITDPTGKLGKGAHLTTIGAIMSRWQMDERDGVLRVISQRGEGRAQNGIGMPEVATFNIWNTRSFQPMGKTTMRLPRQEGLKSVRFDADRAYAITFAQTDPLFVIDLKNPAAPKQRGELVIPGYVFHMEPHGDRVLGLGVDRSDSLGNLNVSLFDVADMDHPRMLQRVSFGPTTYASNEALAATALAEDQDRIQKAFRVLDGGLVVVPFSGAPTYNSSNGGLSCSNASGVQLIEWSQDSLVKRSTLPMAGNPRRALLNQNELIAISDSNVTTFGNLKGSAIKTADLVIGECEVRTTNQGTALPPNNGSDFNDGRGRDNFGDDGYYGRRGFLCSASAGPQSWGACWTGLLLGLAAIGGAVRRRLGA